MAEKVVQDLSDDFLNCCICMNHFKAPKMLPCIHSFCQECLLKYANTQKGNDIACPTCRKVCTLPESGVQGLQTNFYLVNLAEKVTLLEKLTSPEKRTGACDSCKRQEVVAFCFDCNFAICSKCKDQHSLFPTLRSHTVVPTEGIDVADFKFQTGWRNTVSPFCDLHTSEKLNFYCNTCSKLICRDCTIVMHSKPDHDYVDVITRVRTMKESVTTMIDKSNENFSKGLNFIQRGKEGSKVIKEKSTKLKEEISEHCLKKLGEVEKMLNDQKTFLIKAVSGDESKKVEHIEKKIRIAEDWVERMKNAQDITRQIILEDNPWEILGMSADLANAFEALQVESEDLEWEDSRLQQEITFTPERQIFDVHLGACSYPSEVTTDPNGNFIFCHFDFPSKTLHVRILTKESSYSEAQNFPPYLWKHEIPTGAKLNVTAGPPGFLYVALGKVIAIFNCKSKEFSREVTIFEQSRQGYLLSCIKCYPPNGWLCTCVDKNKIDFWDGNFRKQQNGYTLQSNVRPTFMFPSQNDVLFGFEQGNLMRYSLRNRTWSTLTLPPPPEFKDGQMIFYEGMRKGTFALEKQHHPHEYYDGSTTDAFVCFVAWVYFEVDAKSKVESKKWILKEYCTRTNTFLGVLDDLGDHNVEIPAALYCKELGNDGMEIHLCDRQGNVTSYRRPKNEEIPASYEKYDLNPQA